MIRKFIRSNKERGSEVIAELEKLGGINKHNLTGDMKLSIFYINSENCISWEYSDTEYGKIIRECFEEIKLPKKKLKVIEGDEERGPEIIKFLESMGGVNEYNYTGKESDNYYFINTMNNIDCQAIDWFSYFDKFELEIMELPKKKLVLKVIRGVEGRGEDVIKLLKSMGGENTAHLGGNNVNGYYFIANDRMISFEIPDSTFFDDYELEILELPKKKSVLKVIKGNDSRGSEVIKILEDLGGENHEGWWGTDETSYYFINDKGYISYSDIDCYYFKDYELEIIELPKKQEHQFKSFDKVLVRDKVNKPWQCGIFSNINNGNKPFIFLCIGENWKYCIPFEGNEHLLGTTDNPKE